MASDKVLDDLQVKLGQAKEAYSAEMGAANIREFDPAAAVGVCMAHDGEFVVSRLGGRNGLQIGAKRYNPGDRVKLDKAQKAAQANEFARAALVPDYVYDTRRKHQAMRDNYNQAIEPALKAVGAALQEIRQGEALATAARVQLATNEQLAKDGRDHLETALNQAIEALQYRPD